MENKTPQETLPTKRIFLRLPINISGRITFADGKKKNVSICDLSSTGLSFLVKKSQEPPEEFDLLFRLGWLRRTIKTRLVVRNRGLTFGRMRVGCMFLHISERDKEFVSKYVAKYLTPSLPAKIVSFAAFLLTIDASLRISVFLVYLYYSQTPLGAIAADYIVSTGYGTMLLLYAFFSLSAFLLTDQVSAREKSFRFFSGAAFLMFAFIFFLLKNAAYFQLGLWQAGNWYLKGFFSLQLAILLYACFSLWVAVVSLRRVNLAEYIIKQQMESVEEQETDQNPPAIPPLQTSV